MNIQLSDHFTYRRLIRFTISTVLMLICTSMYSIVDGHFCVKLCRENAICGDKSDLAGIYGNRSIGFMLGTGGSAIVAKTLGEGKKEKANQYFFDDSLFRYYRQR